MSTVRRLPHVGYVLTVYPRLSETFVVNEIAELERLGLPLTVFSQKPGSGEGLPVPIPTHAARVLLDSPGLETLAATLGDHVWLLFTRPRRYLALLRFALGRGNAPARKKFWRAGRLARECERRGVVHLHAHFLSGNTRLARMAAELAGVTYSLTAHAKDIYATGLSATKLGRRLAGAAFAVTVSEHNRAYLAAFGDPERIIVIRNGVDLARMPLRSAEPAGSPRVVLAVGRLVEKKGFRVLVAAMAALAGDPRTADVEIWIVGDGPEGLALRTLVAGSGLGSRVKFLGLRPHAEVLALMARASVLAVPSLIAADGDRDGIPTVIPEAMAIGLPVVATRLVGIPELVIDGRTGLLAAPSDALDLARALTALLTDRTAAADLARAARAKVEAEYDLRQNVAALFARYAALAPRAESARARSALAADSRRSPARAREAMR